MKVIVIHLDKLIKVRLLLLSALFILVCFIFLISKSAFAQEASDSGEEKAKKFNITFPVSELGNCSSFTNCLVFCANPDNKDACVAFARKKGFYKNPNEGQGNARQRSLLEKAKVELGCSTEEECKAFCSDEANKDKCAAFAKKYNIDTRSKNPGSKDVLEKARQVLGCNSPESCKAVCQHEANHEKCSLFARTAGLRGGLEKPGSESTRFKNSSESGRFMPNSQEAFEHANENAKFCREHPEKCKNSSGSGILERQTEQEKRKLQLNREIEKKEFEIRKLKEEDGRENRTNKGPGSFNSGSGSSEGENDDDKEDDDSDVQGVSASPSFIAQLIRFFFK